MILVMLRQAKLRLCSFGRYILWISLGSPPDLFYRLYSYVDKQSQAAVGEFSVHKWTLDCWK